MANRTPRGPMGRGQSFEKPKDFKKAIGKLAINLKGNYIAIIISLVFAIAGTVLTIVSPNLIKELTNIITKAIPILVDGVYINVGQSVDISAVVNICILLVVFFALSFVFSYLQGFIMSTVTQRISKKMRKDISTKINRLPLKYIDSTTYGDVLSRVTNDVDTISQSLNNSITTLVSSIVMLAGATLMMFITNWIMALSAIAASIIGFAISLVIMTKSQKYFVEQQNSLGDINGHIEEAYSGHNIIVVSNAKEQTKQEFDNFNKSLYKSGWKSQFLSGLMMPVMNFIGNFGYVVVCVVGAMLTISGHIDFGVIVAFMIYVRLFTNPLSQIAQASTNLQSTAAASERVFEFLDEKEVENDPSATKRLDEVKGNVEFSHVKFGYNKDKLIIKDFSVQITSGQKVAIVGPTGAGKTTLVNLLMRFYDIDDGDILIDGVSIKDMPRDYVHNLFGMVLQDTWLFEGTIYENIIFNQQNVTHEQVENACKACGLHHFIMTLPQGYDTVLDDNTSISAGQKQLLTIARAMVQNAPMLILDEATSSVDTRTETLISSAMDNLTQGRTSFVIAHRLSTIKNADIILVMQNGDIVESGNHQDLLAKNGAYATLYDSQFEE